MLRTQLLLAATYGMTLIATWMLATRPLTTSAAIQSAYSSVFNDAVTGDAPNPISFGGKFYRAIGSGPDSYANDFYERPTTQTYTSVGGGKVGAIVSAKAGLDSQYMYFAIDLYRAVDLLSTRKFKDDGGSDNKGLDHRYRNRLSDQAADGGSGYLLFADQPKNAGTTLFQLLKNEGHNDTNGNVGGAGGSAATGGSGNGFDEKIIGDGKLTSGPNNGKADGGAKDPLNYLWNDEFNQFTVAQAGTPYTTAGRGNVYEFDTLSGGSLPVGSVPEASSIAIWVLLVAAAAFVRSAHRAIRR